VDLVGFYYKNISVTHCATTWSSRGWRSGLFSDDARTRNRFVWLTAASLLLNPEGHVIAPPTLHSLLNLMPC